MAKTSYIRLTKHADSRSIGGHIYRFLRAYTHKPDADAEANRWNREPGISAKVVGTQNLWTVWVSEKRKWRKR